MVYWGGGDGETGRGRRTLDLEVTLVLPQLPAISKTCVTPKEVFCIHFSIFQVDQSAPLPQEVVGSIQWPLDSLLLHWPPAGSWGDRALSPGQGRVTGDLGAQGIQD